jgi:hypothetical protein
MHMKTTHTLAALAMLALSSLAMANPDQVSGKGKFTGSWEIDLRTPDERAAKAECGHAYFTLEQHGNEIIGDHGFATPGCAKVNTASPVHGQVRKGAAWLEVTSTGQGAVVRGRATLVKGQLMWRTLEVLKPGTPEGDSPLILDKGLLYRLPD